jgi:5-formyltetrahydrofolate cyclo-ligase
MESSRPPLSIEDILRQRMKVELRKRMRALRATFPASACAERSTRLVARLGALEPIARARSVALFSPIAAHREVDLSALDPVLRARGTRVAYPRTLPSLPGAMEFRFVSDVGRLKDHPFGMREPADDEPIAQPGELDAIVVPALAADSRGHRIGYGGGYYDRALPLHAPPAVSIAVVLDFQLVVEIPRGEHDVAVDWVVTDARTIRAER